MLALSNNMLRAALFDLDGTIIDSLPDIVEAVNLLRQDEGLSPHVPNEIKSWIGKGANHLVRGCFPKASQNQIDELAVKYIRRYLNLDRPRTCLYPGVRETLLTLKNDWNLKLGVATNKATVSSEQALSRLLPDLTFDCVAGPERVSRRKPDPAHLLEVLESLKVSPSEAFFVGDDPVDEMCARAAGVYFLGANYGIGGVSPPVDQRIDAFSEILERMKAFKK